MLSFVVILLSLWRCLRGRRCSECICVPSVQMTHFFPHCGGLSLLGLAVNLAGYDNMRNHDLTSSGFTRVAILVSLPTLRINLTYFLLSRVPITLLNMITYMIVLMLTLTSLLRLSFPLTDCSCSADAVVCCLCMFLTTHRTLSLSYVSGNYLNSHVLRFQLSVPQKQGFFSSIQTFRACIVNRFQSALLIGS